LWNIMLDFQKKYLCKASDIIYLSKREVMLIIYLIISVYLLIIFFFDQVKKKSFSKWIADNYQDIKNGGAYYKGINIYPNTELVSYQGALSFIIISAKINSRYFIKNSQDSLLINSLYSLLTLFLGWWGFPWGPIYTLESLKNNLKGGEKITVSEFMSKDLNLLNY
ncbi:hypothetical protein, partial [Natronospora cellulosivora (SeqCode)]